MVINNEPNADYNDNAGAYPQQMQQQSQPFINVSGGPQVYQAPPSTYVVPQQVVYVYAPQGCYTVPGNANLIAIPQGQTIPAHGAPMQQQFFFS